MNTMLVYHYPDAPALSHAARLLEDRGVECTATPNGRVTHLLLPVPSLDRKGFLRGGCPPGELLARLPASVTVVGGKLESPAFSAHSRIDLLQDSLYVAENAALTADCALRLAGQLLPVTWKGCPVLVIGWGRIGMFLAELLRKLGAQVSVSARREAHLSMLTALGYEAVAPEALRERAEQFRVVFNTVDTPVLTQTPQCVHNLWMDLATLPGLEGETVIRAGGLPGKMLPESSGRLIGSSLLRILEKGGKTG